VLFAIASTAARAEALVSCALSYYRTLTNGLAVASYNSPFPIKDVVWTGTPKIYKQPLEGTDAFVQRWFCADCGSTLASVSERAPDTIFVKVPLFDSPPPLGAEVFRKRAYGMSLDSIISIGD
jgi:hypothetical protein